ncbi:hypothetical protein ACKKBG_A23935 [Auxenochlorella protothecoides x Auxenochlorella symbiontica]
MQVTMRFQSGVVPHRAPPRPASLRCGTGFKTASTPCRRARAPRLPVQAALHKRSSESELESAHGKALQLVADVPFREPFVRSFLLGIGSGLLLEGAHVLMQMLGSQDLGAFSYSPALVADHILAFTSWFGLYFLEAAAVLSVLKRYNGDEQAAAKDLANLSTLPKRLIPRLPFFSRESRFTKPLLASASEATGTKATATVDAEAMVEPATKLATSTLVEPMPRGGTVVRPQGENSVVRAPPRKPATSVPLPRAPSSAEEMAAGVAKRARELRDRSGYLKNMWYAVALSANVGSKEPVKVQLCGREMVLFRDATSGDVQALDNVCPHRGAPLSSGWLSEKESGTCVVCPYHGWALDGAGALKDVPAAMNKGEWPKRSLMNVYDVEEKGGFVWLFYGSRRMPVNERPPIPYIPELDDGGWRAVYEEMEFECNHFGVFENAIDMAHIHYLHGDSFGNADAPEIKDMQVASDAYGITATFTITNKPVNAFWSMFQVPEVFVTARVFLPSTSVVTFTLGAGLSFTTFVNTVPLTATRSVNRFALIRRLASDRTGLFNARIWDGMARDAMRKILSEDKAMVEQLRYDLLPAEYSVRADLPQVAFRKLRQQYVDMGYGLPTETFVPTHTVPANLD